MPHHERKPGVVAGKTYSLFGVHTDTDHYYRLIKELADLLLKQYPDQQDLLFLIQKAGRRRALFKERSRNRTQISFLKKRLKDSLSLYTKNVKNHLKDLPVSQKCDETLRTSEEQYHLFMLEIEIINRLYRERFKNCSFKFALLPHCLRDFRPGCQAGPGDVESVCRGCNEECFIHLGSTILRKYHVHPYISVTTDLERLFKRLKFRHPDIGAVGIACIPELVHGLRLCIKLHIPAVGIPLDANRCARWMKQCRESSFNLNELEDLLT